MRRDLEYSYLVEQRDYVATDLSTTVSQRLGDRWELVGTVGRYGLSYRRRDANSTLPNFPSDTIVNYRGGIGYYLGRNRLAVDVYQWNRHANVAGRGYGRTRIMSSFSYGF